MKGKFADFEMAFIYLKYKELTDLEIGTALGRPASSINNFRTRYNLKKEGVPNKGQIAKGTTPWNKGKKGYMGANATSFKKGTIPPNTKYDGHERITKEGYVEIRISLGNYVLKHRHNWEQANGPIPKGLILRCKTTDYQNCNPDNWELIDRKTHMIKNSGCLNLPDGQVASYLATKSKKVDPELKQELLKHPELLQVARINYHLKRTIQNESNR